MFNIFKHFRREKPIDTKNSKVQVNNQEPFFIVNKKNRIIDISTSFCEKIGCQKNKNIEIPFDEAFFLTEKGRKQVIDRSISKLTENVSSTYVLEINTKDGPKNYEFESRPYLQNGKEYGNIEIIKNLNYKSENNDNLNNNLQKTEKTIITDTKTKSKNEKININKVKNDFDEKEKEIESLKADLKLRNKIIDNIKQQLVNNQIVLMEKSSIDEQVSKKYKKDNLKVTHDGKEILELRKELFHNQSLLNMRIKELEELQHELEKKESQIDMINSDLKLRNEIINKMKNQITNGETKSIIKIQKMDKLQGKFKNDLSSMKSDIDIRNTLINEMKKQLIDRQVFIKEKIHVADDLHKSFKSRKKELSTKKTNITKIQKELKKKKNELKASNLLLKQREEELEKAQLLLQEKELEILSFKDNCISSTQELKPEKIEIQNKSEDVLDLVEGEIKTKKIEKEELDKI